MNLEICLYFIQLWSQGCKPDSAGPNEIETTQSTFGTGSNVVTRLVNQSGEVCVGYSFTEGQPHKVARLAISISYSINTQFGCT
jgi:hypothetical protein